MAYNLSNYYLVLGTNGNNYNIQGSEDPNKGDYIKAGAGTDYIYANAGNDIVHGGWGNDFISAGAGDDHIYGDAGNDTLRGDAGADWFRFTISNGNDNVVDLRPAEGDVWSLYGINMSAVHYIDYGSSTIVQLDGYKDTITFWNIEPQALQAALVQTTEAYDWGGVLI